LQLKLQERHADLRSKVEQLAQEEQVQYGSSQTPIKKMKVVNGLMGHEKYTPSSQWIGVLFCAGFACG